MTYSTVLDDAVNILVLDRQMLAGMATGECAIVLTDSSSDLVMNRDGEVNSDAPDLGQCVLMSDGVDHWAKISESKKVDLDRRITLRDHVATLSGYLNDYRKTDDVSKRVEMSSLFTDYLSAACWRKMYNRMTHWATLGLIRNLVQISDTSISDSIRPAFMINDDSDPRLARRLITLSQCYDSSTPLKVVMQYHPQKKDDLSNLLSQCANNPPILYPRDTVLNFHYLLVATLVAYGSLLARIHDEKDGSKKHASTLSILARLLSTILHSNALANHLRFLTSHGRLSLPNSIASRSYYLYADLHGFGLGKNDRRRKYTVEGNEDGVDEGRVAERGGGVNTETGDAETDWGDGTPDAEDEDFDACWTGTRMHTAVVVGGWMKTLTSHYSAKRSLEKHCFSRRMEQVKIVLLAVGSDYRKVTWGDLGMAEHEWPTISTEEIIKILEGKIRNARPVDKHPIFGTFKQMFHGNAAQCLCGMHCKVSSAALSVYGHSADVAAKQQLMDLCEGISLDSLISILMFVAEIGCGSV